MVGAGSLRCEKAMTGTSKEILIVLTWAQGWVSGANGQRYAQEGEFLLLPEIEVFASSIEDFCKANPKKTIYQASTNMWRHLLETAPRRKQ